MGIPLQCFMVAECFQNKIDEYILNANITSNSEAFFVDTVSLALQARFPIGILYLTKFECKASIGTVFAYIGTVLNCIGTVLACFGL